ncbi:hypothetical protein [Polymorphum gilvum]|uniref:hypothetical protein n=1 Tax=Polymorphum gilvum TaxID=991904 RepID=UPI00059B8DEE
MRAVRKLELVAAAMLTVTALSAGWARAEEPARGLALELNRTAATDGGCLLTFVALNRSAEALDKAAYEFVLFNSDGLVDQMTVFDFGSLPAGKTVVRQFQLAGLACEAIGSILVNGAAGCGGASAAPPACTVSLETASRTAVPFMQ